MPYAWLLTAASGTMVSWARLTAAPFEAAPRPLLAMALVCAFSTELLAPAAVAPGGVAAPAAVDPLAAATDAPLTDPTATAPTAVDPPAEPEFAAAA